MVRIVVKFMSVARQRVGTGRIEVIASVPKLRVVLGDSAQKFGIRNIILTETGEVRPWARVLVNGRSQEFVGGLDLELHEADTLALVYPYADNFRANGDKCFPTRTTLSHNTK
jgi:molybdopterin converting factor small subunit